MDNFTAVFDYYIYCCSLWKKILEIAFLKKFVVLLIITIIATSGLSGLLFYQLNVVQGENSELKIAEDNLQDEILELEDLVRNHTDKISITHFSTSGLRTVEDCIIFESTVKVKIRNIGINDVTGLTLIIVLFGDENSTSVAIDTINIGEEKEASTKVKWAYDARGPSSATIKLDDLVLDERFLSSSDIN